MRKLDLFKLRIDSWIHSLADLAGKKMDSVSVRKRKVLLLVIFVVALIFLIGQTVLSFVKLHNNI